MIAESPPARPSDVLRSAVGMIGLVVGAVIGILRRAHTRNRRAMVDGMLHDAAHAAAGACRVRVQVVGERPPGGVIYLFNHQSQFDAVVIPIALGDGITAVGKRELARHPIFGPMMRFAGVAFIARDDLAQAKAALAPVVDTLHQGISVVIAPEGTRAPTPHPLPFKKGAFHLAIQAGVPVVPVVLSGMRQVCARDSFIVRPGIVRAEILAPIDVSEWDPHDMNDQVEGVRQQYVAALRTSDLAE